MPRSRFRANKKWPALQNSGLELQRAGHSTCGATFAWFPCGNPLVNMPSHVLPLTRAHGPDTRPSCGLAFPLSLGDPFTNWRSARIPASLVLCECPIGLIFASTVSSYSIETKCKGIDLPLSTSFFEKCGRERQAVVSSSIPPRRFRGPVQSWPIARPR